MSNSGTPSTLAQAIRNGMDAPNSSVESIRQHVRNFIAQHFTVSMLSVNDGSVEHVRLQVLFERLTREQN